MTSIKRLSLASTQMLFMFVLSQPALAHAGHDHSHWSSNFLHILFYASIAAVIAGIGYALFKRSSKTDNPTV